MAQLYDDRKILPSPDSGLRRIAFGVGIVVFAAGLALCLFLFYHIVLAIHDPSRHSDSVDRWEFFVRGRGPIESFAPEPGDIDRLPPAQQAPATMPGASHENELKFMDAVVERGARWAALGFIGMLVLSLCSLAAGIASAGARLMRAGLRPALVYSDDDVEEHRDTGLKKRPRL